MTLYWYSFSEAEWLSFIEEDWTYFLETPEGTVTMDADDISIVLSGGAYNPKPHLSLGGPPSYQLVVGLANNIFGNVSLEQTETGHTDYRCVYILNTSEFHSLYQTKLFTKTPQPSGGALVRLGFQLVYDKQTIVVSGPASGGSFTIRFTLGTETVQGTVDHSDSINVWSANLKTAIEAMIGKTGVTVSAKTKTDLAVFTVTFPDYRYYPTLEVADNSLVGDEVSVGISKFQNGGPVNRNADTVDSGTSKPPNVVFADTTHLDPFEVGTLGPGDFIPVWIEREVGPNTLQKAADGFALRISGNPISDTPQDIVE